MVLWTLLKSTMKHDQCVVVFSIIGGYLGWWTTGSHMDDSTCTILCGHMLTCWYFFFFLENILSCHENLSKINYMTWIDYIWNIPSYWCSHFHAHSHSLINNIPYNLFLLILWFINMIRLFIHLSYSVYTLYFNHLILKSWSLLGLIFSDI